MRSKSKCGRTLVSATLTSSLRSGFCLMTCNTSSVVVLTSTSGGCSSARTVVATTSAAVIAAIDTAEMHFIGLALQRGLRYRWHANGVPKGSVPSFLRRGAAEGGGVVQALEFAL